MFLIPAAVSPGIRFRILPSREAAFTAFKKDPEKFSDEVGAPGLVRHGG
jgi:hypothetical protein